MKKQVIAAVDDLLFAAKIRGAAGQAGADVIFVKTADALLEAARREGGPAVVILDLQTSLFDPFAAAEMLKSDERARGVPVVGYFPHVQADLQRRGRAAGIEHVLPRSVFNQRLLEIVGGEL